MNVDYQEWEQTVPVAITGDALWTVRVYRLALFAADAGWHDVTRLSQDKQVVGLADQLYRALGSISANIAEGYSRESVKDQARFVTTQPLRLHTACRPVSLRGPKARSNLLDCGLGIASSLRSSQ